MKQDIQRRTAASAFELRGDSRTGATLSGHAAVFGIETTIASLFREQIAPGAFRKTIGEADIRCLLNHNPDHILGRNRSGTLRLSEDGKGLAYEVDLPDTQTARDLYTSIERGDISQSSFAFQVVREKRAEPTKGQTLPLFTVQEAKLYDVSPVTFPQYPEADVSAASDDANLAAAVRRFSEFCGRPAAEVLLYMQNHPEDADLRSLWTRALAASWHRVRDTLTIS
jgi:hypothetical protein